MESAWGFTSGNVNLFVFLCLCVQRAVRSYIFPIALHQNISSVWLGLLVSKNTMIPVSKTLDINLVKTISQEIVNKSQVKSIFFSCLLIYAMPLLIFCIIAIFYQANKNNRIWEMASLLLSWNMLQELPLTNMKLCIIHLFLQWDQYTEESKEKPVVSRDFTSWLYLFLFLFFDGI